MAQRLLWRRQRRWLSPSAVDGDAFHSESTSNAHAVLAHHDLSLTTPTFSTGVPSRRVVWPLECPPGIDGGVDYGGEATGRLIKRAMKDLGETSRGFPRSFTALWLAAIRQRALFGADWCLTEGKLNLAFFTIADDI